MYNVPSGIFDAASGETAKRNKKPGKNAIQLILPKNDAQDEFLRQFPTRTVNFCVGLAGSGKTFLACAAAANALEQGLVEKIWVIRPAIEAVGEKIGFIPGDPEEKTKPYMRPVKIELEKILGEKKLNKIIAAKQLEFLPLGHTRGLTFNEAVVICDEAQNFNRAALELALGRVGEKSQIIFAGDAAQDDLRFLSGARSSREPGADLIQFMKDLQKAGSQDPEIERQISIVTLKENVRNDVINRIFKALRELPQEPNYELGNNPSDQGSQLAKALLNNSRRQGRNHRVISL